jgi:hypothetical protein
MALLSSGVQPAQAWPGGSEGGDPFRDLGARGPRRGRTPRSSSCSICEMSRPNHETGRRTELTGPATAKPAGPRVPLFAP